MSKKYYTPSIEEFRVNFEYEQEDMNEGGASSSWFNYKIEVPNDIQEVLNGDELGFPYRVKYLDRADIESLGWGHNAKESGASEITIVDYYKHNKFWMLVRPQDKMVVIYESNTDKPRNFWHNTRNPVFQGKINNKSELQMQMKKLNI